LCLQVLHPQGHYAVTSSRAGKLNTYDLQPVLEATTQTAAAAASSSTSSDEHNSGAAAHQAAAAAAAEAVLAAAGAAVVKQPLLVEHLSLQGSVVDCMRFLSGADVGSALSRNRVLV
jgi:hypothetical protein